MSEYNTFKDWLIDTLGPQDEDDTGYLEDLVEHGAAGGFSGLTYYSETTQLYEQYTEELWDTLRQIAQDMGYGGVLGLLVECAGGNDQETDYQFKNLVVWVVAEHLATRWLDNKVHF